MGIYLPPILWLTSYGESWEPRKKSAVRGPADRPDLHRWGAIQGDSARPGEILRSRRPPRLKVWDFAPREPETNRVEISPRSPGNSRQFAGPPPGRFFGKEVRFRGFRPTFRNSAEYPLTWPGRVGGFAPHDSAADCVEISPVALGAIGGSRATHPVGSSVKGCDSGDFAQSSEIQRNTTYLVWECGVSPHMILRPIA